MLAIYLIGENSNMPIKLNLQYSTSCGHLSMYYHRLLYLWTTDGRLVYKCQHHNGPPTPYKIKINRLIVVMRIELTRAILMPGLSNFLSNSTIYFHMCLYLVPCFLRVMVSLLCRSQGRIISSPFIN